MAAQAWSVHWWVRERVNGGVRGLGPLRGTLTHSGPRSSLSVGGGEGQPGDPWAVRGLVGGRGRRAWGSGPRGEAGCWAGLAWPKAGEGEEETGYGRGSPGLFWKVRGGVAGEPAET